MDRKCLDCVQPSTTASRLSFLSFPIHPFVSKFALLFPFFLFLSFSTRSISFVEGYIYIYIFWLNNARRNTMVTKDRSDACRLEASETAVAVVRTYKATYKAGR